MRIWEFPGKTIRWLKWRLALNRPPEEAYLGNVSGVIHVGANLGQERMAYASRRLNVLWVEPIPDVFDKLRRNIRFFPFQSAARYLLTDTDGETVTFNVASNGGASSSIFEMAHHADIWPDISFVSSIEMVGTTLKTMVEREKIDLGRYDALVMDVQGSELLVLKGAGDLIRRFSYIVAEAADFDSYAGGCSVKDLSVFLNDKGFVEVRRDKFAEREQGGAYYDILFERQDIAA